MTRFHAAHRAIACIMLLSSVPMLAASAAERCAHEAPKTLVLDLAGVKTVAFEIGAQSLTLRPATSSAGAISARACASSPAMLKQLSLTQRREGTVLVVSAKRDRTLPLMDENDRYAHLAVNASLPGNLDIRLQAGAGEADIQGFAAVQADVGAGELTVRDVAGTLAVRLGAGDIKADRIGDLRVSALGAGEMTVRNLRGDARIGRVGPGALHIEQATGNLHIDAIGTGGVRAMSIGGNVTVGRVGAGGLDASNVGGDLTVGHVGLGSVDHRNIAGRVRIASD
jgi:DUF4097 and DUF4098 domain-containing protein YvlB